jgi:hypothetical protein
MADTPTPTAPATPSTPTFAPFTDMVWGAFAGAEPFADGGEPLFTEGRFTLGAQRAWIVVLDATGGCLSVEGDPQSDYGGYILGRPFATPAAAEAWFRKEVGAPAHLLDFLMAGFVRC